MPHMDNDLISKVVVSVECMSIIGDCCRGTPLPSRNVLLNALEPPRREKRGSVRMANMIANKGLPVELEPTEGLFAGRAAAAAAAANVAAAGAAAGSGAADGAATGRAPGTTAEGTAAESSAEADGSFQLQPQSPAPSMAEAAAAAAANVSNASATSTGTGGAVAEGRAVGGTGGGVVDANAAWISSNAKAKERAAGKPSDLGAAGKMRAEVSSGVLPMLQGFVPGPVTDLLAVSEKAERGCAILCTL